MLGHDLPLRFDSALQYIEDHSSLFYRFLRERVREEDQERAAAELIKEPAIVANMLKNNQAMTDMEKMDKVMDLVSTPGNVTVMIGAKRHGKTATAFWAIDLLLDMGKKIIWYGYSQDIAKHYPQLTQTFNTKKVEDAVLVVDESAIIADALDFAHKEQKDRMKLIWVSGHSDYSTIYISQTFRINVKILNAMDIIWFKPFFNMDFDRVEARDKFSETYEYLKPVRKNENLVIDRQTNNSWFFENDLPAKWCDGLSKPLRKLKTREDAMKYLHILEDAKMSKREIRMMLAMRGIEVDDIGPGRKDESLTCPKCGWTAYGHGERKGKMRYRCTNPECRHIWQEKTG